MARRYLAALVLTLAAASAVPAARAMMHLYAELRSDLEALLPADSPAVRGVQTMRRRMEGAQHLGIVVRGAQPGAPAAFAEALGARLRDYAARHPDLIRSVRTDVALERRFVREHGFIYMPLERLRRVHARLAGAVESAVASGGDVSQLAANDDPWIAGLISDLQTRRQALEPFPGRFPADRLVSNDGLTALVVVFLATTDTGTGTIGPFVEHVHREVAAMAPAARGLRIGYAGDVAIAVEELSALESDIGVSAALVVLGVVVAITLFFRWWGALVAIALPLAIGTAWGFGIASFFVDSLCSSTAFLGSIVIGNGINPGIMLCARYCDERRQGAAPRRAAATAVGGTWKGTLAAAVAASAGYASLAATTFRGFNEFAVIGSVGMLACWAATYLLLPHLLLLLDRRARAERRATPARGWHKSWLEQRVSRHPRAILMAGGGLLIISLAIIPRFDATHIEYDMSKLRNRDSRINGEAYWSRQMDAVTGRNFTAVALMSDTESDARRIAAALARAAAHEPLRSITSRIVTPDEVLPADSEQRRRELQAIAKLLAPVAASAPTAQLGALLAGIAKSAAAPSPEAGDLPEFLALGMREKDGGFGRTVLLLQSLDGSTWNGALTIRAAAALRDVAERTQPPAHIAGGFFVSANVLAALESEALPTTLTAFCAVVLVVVVLFRARAQAFLVLGSLLAGLTLLAGIVIAFDLRINFLNFMAFPITFGIGAEYAINVLQRYRERAGDAAAGVARTARAVALCSLTTIMGYGSLLVASNQALFSFGVLAVLGEITCLLAAVLLLPAALRVAPRLSRMAATSSNAGR